MAKFAVVALCYRFGVEAQLLEAGLPVLVLALSLHHQVLHAVDETEMHILCPTTTMTQSYAEDLRNTIVLYKNPKICLRKLQTLKL